MANNIDKDEKLGRIFASLTFIAVFIIWYKEGLASFKKMLFNVFGYSVAGICLFLSLFVAVFSISKINKYFNKTSESQDRFNAAIILIVGCMPLLYLIYLLAGIISPAITDTVDFYIYKILK